MKRSVRFYVNIVGVVLITIFVVKIVEHNASQKLIMAIQEQDREKINKLVKSTWNVNSTNGFKVLQLIEFPVSTPMSQACRLNDYETVNLLLKKGASVNHIMFDTSSPLCNVATHYQTSVYAGNNSYNLLKLLLERGANPNQKTELGYPIFRMCYHVPKTAEGISKYLAGFKLLIDYGADLNITWNGKNIIEAAANESNYVLLEYLLDNYNFDINNQNSKGDTVLMVNTNNIRIVKLLLSKGADKSIKNNEGKTAYDICVEEGNKDCLQLLKCN